MKIDYSGTTLDIDKPAYEVQAERPDQPIRVRLQPTLLRTKNGIGNYQAWPRVSWTVECRTAEEAIGVRVALEAFFQAIAQHGAAAVEKALTPTAAVR